MSGQFGNEVYEWCPEVENYEWLYWLDEDYGKADEPFARSQRFGGTWRPRVLIRQKNPNTAERPISDCPKGPVSMRLLSRRGLDVLRDLLEPSCEILPLHSELGEFYAINCLLKQECIDLQKSAYELDDYSRIRQVNDWVFDLERLPNVHVFRVPHSCTTFLVSRAFVDRVRASKLLGFRLLLLWSPDTGPITQQDATRWNYHDVMEPWEKKEVLRLKAEIRRQRKERQAKAGGTRPKRPPDPAP